MNLDAEYVKGSSAAHSHKLAKRMRAAIRTEQGKMGDVNHFVKESTR